MEIVYKLIQHVPFFWETMLSDCKSLRVIEWSYTNVDAATFITRVGGMFDETYSTPVWGSYETEI